MLYLHFPKGIEDRPRANNEAFIFGVIVPFLIFNIGQTILSIETVVRFSFCGDLHCIHWSLPFGMLVATD